MHSFDQESIDVLRAMVRLSLARMYLVDLERGYNFGNMVDGRGAGFVVHELSNRIQPSLLCVW